MAKIKILANVAHKGHILKKDSVLDVPAREADMLIDGKHAEIVKEQRQQQQQQQQQPPPPPEGEGDKE